MEIKGKVHCFFEQSGTFKREFVKLGIPAEDYDIQNNFGETDHVIDLFAEIEKGYDGKPSIFDGITPDDLVMAFFPCIHFCNIAEYNQRSEQERWRAAGVPLERIWGNLKRMADERHYFYVLCLKMHAVIECRGLRLIMENPWHVMNYTNYFWFMKPSVIDTDRTRMGDWFMKPTAYWFTNCKPSAGGVFQRLPKEMRRFIGVRRKDKKDKRVTRGSSKAGLCSEESSMISPDYARNFICGFILGVEQDGVKQQLTFKEFDNL